MAGRQDRDDAKAEYLTPFALYRTDINPSNTAPFNETDPALVPEVIDISNSASGVEHNKICLIFKRLTGNKQIFTASLYCTLKDTSSPLYNTTVLVDVVNNVEEDKIIILRRMYAGSYKILLSNVDGGSYSIYESHAHNPKIGDTII